VTALLLQLLTMGHNFAAAYKPLNWLRISSFGTWQSTSHMRGHSWV